MSGTEPGHAGASRSWRPQASRKRVRSTRRLKLIGGVTFLASLVGLLLWLLLRTSSAPTVTFIGIGKTDYGRSIALNPGAKEDMEALAEVFEAIHESDPDTVSERVDTSNYLDRTLLGPLAKDIGGAETLVVFCSLHAIVDYGGATPAVRLLVKDLKDTVSFKEFLAVLDSSSAKQVVLLLDVASEPDWTQGSLSRNVVAQAAREADSFDGRIAVICATSGVEDSWAAPIEPTDGDSEESDTPIPRWENQPGTIFGRAIHNAFTSESADTNDNKMLELGELFESIRNETAEWNQTVAWINETKGSRRIQLTKIAKPPAVEESEDAAGSDEEVAAAGSADKKEPAKASPKEGSPVSTPEERIHALWMKRDAIWLTNPDDNEAMPGRSGQKIAEHPLAWREFNYELVRIEQAIRHHLHSLPEYTDDITARLTSAEAVAGKFADESGESISLAPSIEWSSPAMDDKAVKPDAVFKLLLATEPTADAPDQPTPIKNVDEKMRFAKWLVTDLISRPQIGFGEHLTAVSAALNSLDEPKGLYWPRKQWPVELQLVSKVATTFSTAPVDAATGSAIRRTIRQRVEANRMFGLLEGDRLRPEIHKHVAQLTEANLSSTLAAERWLIAKQVQRANQWLDIAQQTMDDTVRRADAVRNLLSVREALLAEFPDHAQWIASKLEFDGLKFTESIPRVASAEGEALQSVAAVVEEIDKLLSRESELQDRTVDELTATAKRALQRFDQGFTAFVAGLGEQTRWPEVDRVLQNPWIRASSRQKLVQFFRDRQSGQIKRKNSEGIWQEYWCNRTLSLAFPDLAQTITSNTRERGNRGREFASKWEQLGTMLGQPGDLEAVRFDRCARLATRVPSTSAEKIERGLLESRMTLLRSARTAIANNWVRQGQAYTDLTQRFTGAILDAGTLSRTPDPQLTGLPIAPLNCSSDGTAAIKLDWNNAANDGLDVLLLGDEDVVWSDQSKPLRSVSRGETLSLKLQSQTPQKFQLALVARSAGSGKRGYEPYDVRSLTLAPEFNSAGWSIAFAVPGTRGKTYLSGQPRGQVWLNPNTPTTAEVWLNRPAGRGEEKFVVTLLRPDATRTPIGLSGEATFENQATSCRLDLKGAAPGSELDVSGGITFNVRSAASEDQRFDLKILPWVPPREFFVQTPKCEVIDDQLIVTVRRQRKANVPKKLSLTVEPGQALRKLLEEPAPKTKTLAGSLDVTLVKFGLKSGADTFGTEISLSVAGIPHAYRWKLDGPGPQTLLPETGSSNGKPGIRFATPSDTDFAKSDDEVPNVRIETYFPHNDFFTARPATLELQLRKDGSNDSLDTWVVRGPERTTSL
ncbi:MAG: hypothetical protein AB8G99_22810, partial [Planctomycetaceae bacterium]